MNAFKLLPLLGLLLVGSAYTGEKYKQDVLRTTKNEAFTHGEELRYRVHYGWINAAAITIKVDNKPTIINGRDTYKISAYGKTFRSFDWAFKVRDNFVSN
mgnify:FL=1